MRQPAVAMPFTEAEGTAALWRTRVRSVMLRAGALVYQFLKAPLERLAFEKCDRTDITREETWPPDFSFAYEEGEITQDRPTPPALRPFTSKT